MNNRDFFQQTYDKNSVDNLNDYISFCTLESRLRPDEEKIKDLNEHQIRDRIPYYHRNDFYSLKSMKVQNAPIHYLKNSSFNKISIDSAYNLYALSGVLKINAINKLISLHNPFSFAIQGRFELLSPFYSADDDHYYIIDNPVLKENVFKVPMMRGSSWKGVLATAIRAVIKKNKNDLLENYMSFVRLFGAGSEEFRNMINLVSEKEIKNDDFQKKLRWYAITKLGKQLDLTVNNLDKKILDEIKKKSLQVQRGRLIFYPTYFDKLGLEMINPHKRRTKAGTNPVYYEVVPKGASGIFQLLYIPADGITQSEHELKEEVEKDFDLLTNGLKRIFQEQQNDAQIKIGAKTKLGWGKVKADRLEFIKRKEDSLNSPDSSFLKEYTGGAE